MLSAQAKVAIYNSMTPLECAEGTDIIVQGDKDARTFYVLESGSCDVYINKSKDQADGMKKVHQYAAARCGIEFAAILRHEPRPQKHAVRSDAPDIAGPTDLQ